MLSLMLSIARSAFSFWECKGTPFFHGGTNKTSFPVEIYATSMAKCDKSPKMYKKVSQNKIRTGDTCMIKKPGQTARFVPVGTAERQSAIQKDNTTIVS